MNPVVRYSALVAFGPIFMMGDMRAFPPLSAPWDVKIAYLIGTLAWGWVFVAVLGFPLMEGIEHL